MDRTNFAYDLTIYETELDPSPERKPSAGKTINAKKKFGYSFKKACNLLTITVIASLLIAVVTTNAQLNEYTSKIAQAQNNIVQLESEKTYLEFSLESKMSLKNVEEYAVGTLGLVKMDAAQVEYIELEEENKIEVKESQLKEKLENAIKPLMSYLLP